MSPDVMQFLGRGVLLMSQASQDLIVHQSAPLNAEPPLDRLRASFVTPIERFYIRSHGSIPRLDFDQHHLKVNGLVGRPLELSMRELQERFPRKTVMATLQCAGNRRSELNEVRPVTGTKWEPGAIGNAEWAGAALADVLGYAGVQQADAGKLHVAFDSVDEIQNEGDRFSYGASIPLVKALQGEVLLAYEMNASPLTPEHGFPLRVIVPGYIGARSVKWLAGIRVQDEPSSNYFQQKDYKLFPSDMNQENVDWEAGMMLYDIPVNAVICEPGEGVELPAGPVIVRGYAIAGGRSIARVEISADQGQNWARAAFEHPRGEPWTWTLWESRLDLPPGEHELTVRAWDRAAQTQPEEAEHIWNFKGFMNNAWHQVHFRTR
ncbi:MAG: molybdopterin-dependent oxidoreductase [Acetobacteraceae bacterium]|nr:molybdopterin-dependent oxidoreductase [Acetobacteraceae bacterium]MBV8591661.1 molybdopterin-dependent oxidoreductase [Acetobacteraceae bacterium]